MEYLSQNVTLWKHVDRVRGLAQYMEFQVPKITPHEWAGLPLYEIVRGREGVLLSLYLIVLYLLNCEKVYISLKKGVAKIKHNSKLSLQFTQLSNNKSLH